MTPALARTDEGRSNHMSRRQTTLEYAPVISAIAEKRKALSPERALLVGISGIDASGKGFVTAKLSDQLKERGWKIATIGVDDWLNLPHVRYDALNPATHFFPAQAFHIDRDNPRAAANIVISNDAPIQHL